MGLRVALRSGVEIRTFLSYRLLEPDMTAGAAAIVVDQLRASTTMCYALESGARAIVPCEEIDEAKAVAKGFGGGGMLLGGERGGVLIEGFDLGNSPGEFTRERVGGKTIVFTSTNGTRAVRRAAGATRAFIGSLANRTAVSRAAAGSGLPVLIVCAGIRGQVSSEDIYAAGAIARALLDLGLTSSDDATMLAVDLWSPLAARPAALLAAMHRTQGGRNLASVGLSADVEVCSRTDALNVVPVLDLGGRIVAESAC